jgi:hypothetical protein
MAIKRAFYCYICCTSKIQKKHFPEIFHFKALKQKLKIFSKQSIYAFTAKCVKVKIFKQRAEKQCWGKILLCHYQRSIQKRETSHIVIVLQKSEKLFPFVVNTLFNYKC